MLKLLYPRRCGKEGSQRYLLFDCLPTLLSLSRFVPELQLFDYLRQCRLNLHIQRHRHKNLRRERSMSGMRIYDSNEMVRGVIHPAHSNRKISDEVVHSGSLHQSQGQQEARHTKSVFHRLPLNDGSLVSPRLVCETEATKQHNRVCAFFRLIVRRKIFVCVRVLE